MNSMEERAKRIESKEAAYWQTMQEIQEKLIEIHRLIAEDSKKANDEGYMLRLLWQRKERQLNGLEIEGINERMLYERRAARECTGLKNGA